MKKAKKEVQKKKGKPSPKKKEILAVPPKKRGRGQPTIFNDALAKTICLRLSKGESLRSICRDDKMPDIGTILNWLFDDDKKQFIEDYERARDIQTDIIFEETQEIADNSIDVIEGDKSDGARVSAVKLSVDTRKWFLSRMKPKKYGEKIDVTSGGKEIKSPRSVAINYGIPLKPKAT